jgi:Domain of unknown function (DUF4136)
VRRHVLRLTAAVLSAITLSACAARMTVSSHVERGLDLSRYRTFDWGPADALPTGDPRLDRNPFFKDHVQGAVEKGLFARGLRLPPTGSPDLLIHYHAHISQRLDVNHVDRVYGYCSQSVCPPDIVRYEAGTLVLDIVDAQTNRVIWRGWAQNSVGNMLENRDVMAKTIDQAVERMLLRLPSTH